MKSYSFLLLLTFLLVLTNATAQNVGDIIGNVVGDDGNTIIGANVIIQGGNYGDATDVNGNYIIHNVAPGKKKIVITSVGFATQTVEVEVVAGEKTTKNFKLKSAYSELNEVVVSGDLYSDEYLTNATTIGTKVPIHPKELPFALDVLSKYMLDQIEPVRITDAVQYVSGVNQETGFGGRTDIYIIRGFRSERESIFKNGFRNPMRIYRESSNIQQIEIVKGPASALYGVSDPGGTINIVTKAPKSYKHGEVSFTTNSFGMVRPSFDIGGPLDDEGKMKFRLNGAIESGGTYRDFVNTERYFLAPVLTYDISPRTKITVQGEYLNHSQPTDRGVPLYDPNTDTKYSFEPNKSFGDPYNETKNTNNLTQYEVAHQINDKWTFRNAGNMLFTNGARNAVEVSGFVAPDSVKRYYQDQRHSEQYLAMQNEFLGSFNWGSTKHKAVLGVEVAQTTTDMFIQQDKSYDTVSVYNTEYNQLPPNELDMVTTNDYLYTINNYGFYVQDFIELTNWLNVIGGVRYDIYQQEYNNRKNGEITNSTYMGVSPRVGVMGKLTKSISLFTNLSTGFNPQWGNPADKNGNLFDPIVNTSFDFGAKLYFLNDKFNITATYFDLTRNGMLVQDPTDQDFQVQTGVAKSNGIEFDLQGEPLPGWTFMTSYSYTNARITEDTNPDMVGQALLNVAPHMYKLWMNYEIQRGGLKGFGAGVGYNYVSERAAANVPNSEMLPEYNLIEGNLFYRADRWSTTLTVKNLTNTEYYVGSQNYNRVMPGAPRHFVLSFKYLF
ncbi:TonB-dependent siderophore receptor [Flammeovirga pectinis]|uniref:TonB-dependent siderophore receptor n=1 Tax=Flammeovirga pectinis TaxID=2494373 RepID=A0A3S9P3D3_9BACT|nr:TonB-dependent receptor [Flammeovirga pectinis]AZQ62701.1 TonB-dependent siderophore receptor [Flammeovirga pectinis]